MFRKSHLRAREVPSSDIGASGRSSRSSAYSRKGRGMTSRADHLQSATHDLRICSHTAAEAWHGCLMHSSRQLMARLPWAAIAGNENCIATTRASAASMCRVMRQLLFGTDEVRGAERKGNSERDIGRVFSESTAAALASILLSLAWSY
jgi:hypothetical protein